MKWDVAIRKSFASGPHPFELDVAFQRTASRLVLFGPSGAGKSMTLRAIAGLLEPDAGHVAVDGRPLSDAATRLFVPPRDRALGYVFQDYALFPHLTVRQNVAFGTARGWRNPSRRSRDPRVDLWMESFGLAQLADRYPEQLSGGQRQRTALARALVVEPRALLLDEPFAALDGPLRGRLRADLSALQQRLGFPMILITHDQVDVDLFGEAVITLDDGRVTA